MQGITNFWNSFWSNVPDVIVAILVLVLAFVVAWIAKVLILKLIKAVGLERGLSKAGVESKNIERTRNFIGQLTYLIVFILFLPGIFEKLGLNNIATPIVQMMNNFMVYLPKIIGAVIILLIGFFIAKVVKEILNPVFKKLKLNERLEKIGVQVEKVNVGDILATTIYVVIVVLFAVEALNTLQLDVLTRIGNAIISYLPYAVSAVIVLILAFLLGTWVEKGLVKKFKTSAFTGLAARVAIIVVGVFMALYQLGIASAMVNSAFIIILGAVAVAFAIAFGIGGREFAAHTMRKLEKKLEENEKKRNQK